jgi:hypothetical protein
LKKNVTSSTHNADIVVNAVVGSVVTSIGRGVVGESVAGVTTVGVLLLVVVVGEDEGVIVVGEDEGVIVVGESVGLVVGLLLLVVGELVG